MDWIDYRERLGIGFCEEEKLKLFTSKMLNMFSVHATNIKSGFISFEEYFYFCDLTGTIADFQLNERYYWENRLNACVQIINRHNKSLAEYLSYYIAFVNSLSLDRDASYNRKHFIYSLESVLKEAHIPYGILEHDNEFYVYPKGVPEMDEALVSQPLEWLSEYPAAQNAWAKALKDYSEAVEDNASEVADKFRKALETFFQEFFGSGKSLENYKSEYGSYLKGSGVPKEISGNFETILQSYTNYINGFAKHRDATSDNILEYLMYQTGNVIRLLITLKKDEA